MTRAADEGITVWDSEFDGDTMVMCDDEWYMRALGQGFGSMSCFNLVKSGGGGKKSGGGKKGGGELTARVWSLWALGERVCTHIENEYVFVCLF